MILKDIYEKANLFYLGRDVDSKTQESIDEALTLYKSKKLTTHAAIIGMTGSGKTGLGIALIEEAAIDNIPVIAIDPKGDIGNLLLCDPTFSAQEFAKWCGSDVEDERDRFLCGEKNAKLWEDGLKRWGQDRDRVARFASVKKSIYTPGSSMGISVNILGSLEAPESDVMDDYDLYGSYLKSTVSSILGLLGLESSDFSSRESILLSRIFDYYWKSGESVALEKIISSIIEPPFKRIGVLPTDSFYPSSDRMKLAMKINSLIASPQFAGWLEGEKLDISSLLYDETGRAKISIFYLNHLSDEQRMFFVTTLLNRYLTWMRRESGSSRLKTILYMDEIYGYFPPTKNPPSKEPMLTLLKQARAFGTGVVLSTQNPVDIDYRGLSNIGTWFVGRLQTKQDIAKVSDALAGRDSSKEAKEYITKALSSMKKRHFILRDAGEDNTKMFETRWVMSYLKGPLDRGDIIELMKPYKESMSADTISDIEIPKSGNSVDGYYKTPPLIDSDTLQYFETPYGEDTRYTPTISAQSTILYHDIRRGIELEKSAIYTIDISDMQTLDWSARFEDDIDYMRWRSQAPSNALFKALPDFVTTDKGLMRASRALRDTLYREERLTLYRCRRLRMESKPNESESAFRARVMQRLDDMRDEEIEKLSERFAKRKERLEDRLKRAEERVEKEKMDQTSSILNAGVSLLGALFGGSKRSIGTTISRGGRVLKERSDLSRAQRAYEDILEKLDELESELEEAIEKISQRLDISNYPIEGFSIKPKKRDISISSIALVWRVEV